MSEQNEISRLANTEIRIAHLSVVKRLTAGQTAQLEAESTAEQAIPGVKWSTFALQDTEPHAPLR